MLCSRFTLPLVAICICISLAEASFAPVYGVWCHPISRRGTKTFYKPKLSSNRRPLADDSIDNNLAAMERDVLESTKARLDLKRVASILNDDVKDVVDRSHPNYSALAIPWKIALAAALGAGSISFLAFKNVYLSGIVAFVTAVAAMGDPSEEESIAGALARVVGRLTLQSVDVTQSKVRVMARAIMMGEEEISTLKADLAEKEQELLELRRWKQLRIAVDDALPRFALDDLKELARKNGMMVGGSKTQLLMRLAEAGIIDL